MRGIYKSFNRGVSLSKGFTLIELLIVIAIIAILATMAIPRIQEYRRAATIAKLTNDARICLAAISQNEALSIISGATTLATPSGCTPSGTTQCACTNSDLGITVTCTINADGTVSCSSS